MGLGNERLTLASVRAYRSLCSEDKGRYIKVFLDSTKHDHAKEDLPSLLQTKELKRSEAQLHVI